MMVRLRRNQKGSTHGEYTRGSGHFLALCGKVRGGGVTREIGRSDQRRHLQGEPYHPIEWGVLVHMRRLVQHTAYQRASCPATITWSRRCEHCGTCQDASQFVFSCALRPFAFARDAGPDTFCVAPPFASLRVAVGCWLLAATGTSCTTMSWCCGQDGHLSHFRVQSAEYHASSKAGASSSPCPCAILKGATPGFTTLQHSQESASLPPPPPLPVDIRPMLGFVDIPQGMPFCTLRARRGLRTCFSLCTTVHSRFPKTRITNFLQRKQWVGGRCISHATPNALHAQCASGFC